ncbi:hypothetical protein OFM36_38690, partial [Escherichia coli]|nr:hypothetical protein [Escherichia coli]
GLADTVQEGHTGFVFDDPEPAALQSALERALAAYRQPVAWRALQQAGMGQDHGWEASAARYAALYGDVLARRGADAFCS